MTRRGVATLVIVATCSLGCGCQGADRPPVAAADSSPSALPPVVLPDLSALAESVQRQLRERDAQLAQVLANGGSPARDRAAAYAALGHVLMAATFSAEAVSCYRHAQVLSPDDRRWPYYLGHAYLRAGDRPRAAAAFERALELQPSDMATLVWLAETYLDDGRLDQAQATFDRALSRQPQSAAALFGAGRTALARQAYPEAVQQLERALSVDSQAAAVHYPLAMAYRGMGDSAKAEAHLRQRGNGSPALPDPLMQQVDVALESALSFEGRGMQALRAADFTTAIASFRKGLELSRDDPSLRYWLGAALYASGRPADAEREFTEVLRLSPGFAKAHFSRGAIADARGRRDEAIAHYREAVRADPGMADARLRLADDLRATRQLDAAFAEYDAASRLDPAIVESWTGGAQTLIALGRKEQAQEWLTRALRLHPGRPELSALRSRLR